MDSSVNFRFFFSFFFFHADLHLFTTTSIILPKSRNQTMCYLLICLCVSFRFSSSQHLQCVADHESQLLCVSRGSAASFTGYVGMHGHLDFSPLF